ncbi:MAG TPA: hypothetical protein VEY51_06900 [Chondromyces sp.]|nr:hypothetical protein [Chondromyces sp.]
MEASLLEKMVGHFYFTHIRTRRVQESVNGIGLEKQWAGKEVG